MRLVLFAVLVCLAAPSASALSSDDSERAARYFAEGQRAYEHGDFELARLQFEAARRLRPVPELHFDIARCWDQLGRHDQAIAEYRRYLAAAPDGPNVTAVRARIAALEPPAPAAPSTAARDRRRLVAPIAVGGAALVTAVVAAALVGSVAPEYDHLRQSCMGACMPSQWSGLEARANAGYALFGIAGAVAVADGVLWYLALRHGPGARAQLVAPSATREVASLAAVRF
jgi:tetratricopeptide (TPR) repeat protein